MRKWVRMGLRNDGWDVNMVGTQRDGKNMTDGVRVPLDQPAYGPFFLFSVTDADSLI